MPTIVPIKELLGMAGHELPPSSWFEIEQNRVDRFADATEDHQYIHVDPERAAATPFGGTIAHGYLSLSLLPRLSAEHAVRPEGLVMAINYGLDRVRFLQPVRTGSRVRLRSKIDAVTEKGPGRILLAAEATLEIEGEEVPAFVADTLTLFLVG